MRQEFEVTDKNGEKKIVGEVIPDEDMKAEFIIDINNSEYSDAQVRKFLHQVFQGKEVEEVNWTFE